VQEGSLHCLNGQRAGESSSDEALRQATNPLCAKGSDGLALLVQETLRRNPHNGHLFVFRGRRGGLKKVLWHDGQRMAS
jgi:transposase